MLPAAVDTVPWIREGSTSHQKSAMFLASPEGGSLCDPDAAMVVPASWALADVVRAACCLLRFLEQGSDITRAAGSQNDGGKTMADDGR